MQRLFFLCGVVLWLLGCSTASVNEVGYPQSERVDVQKSLFLQNESSGEAVGSAPVQMRKKLAVMAPEADGLLENDVAAKTAAPMASSSHRMVFYNGGISLKVTEPQVVLDSACARAQRVGGYVESREASSAILRIPVSAFSTFFDQVLGWGVVLNKWMRAEDITDAFSDNELRIHISEATLARLQELLAASTSDEEKLKLLRDIQRVQDELESRKNQQAYLKNKADFSKLELQVEPFVFEERSSNSGIEAFEWFDSLNPQRTEEGFLGSSAKLKVPDQFVDLKLSKAWASRSADGVDLWIFKRLNEPLGSASFWTEALKNSLSYRFEHAEISQMGDFSVLRLTAYGPETFVWWIAVYTDHKKLYVVETYFPDTESEARHQKAVQESLVGGVQ